MEQKRQEALRLYLTQGRTQREIALAIGVSERTIYSWIQKYAWDKLRYASYQGPAMIAEKLCNQLVELQNAIDRREPGLRYPTKDESQIIHRLILDIEKMRKFPSLGVTMQVLQTFRNHIRKSDKQLADKLNVHFMLYTEEKAAGGLYPLSYDFDNENVSPIALSADEEPDYTRFYQYRVPEDEILEEETNKTSGDQQLTTQEPLPNPQKTGSESEDGLNEIAKILRRDISFGPPRKENKEKLAQQLQRWQKFAKSVKNASPSSPLPRQNPGNEAV